MPEFTVSFPSSTAGYLCTSFFSLPHSLAVQDYHKSKLIEPGSKNESITELLQRVDVAIPLNAKAQTSFRRLVKAAKQLESSKTVPQCLNEATDYLGPLKFNFPKLPYRPSIKNIGHIQNYQLYALSDPPDSLLLPEPLMLKKDALSFFCPANFVSKAPSFISIHDPLEAVDPIQKMKPCPSVHSPHFSSLETHLEPDEVLPISPPDIVTAPLLFFEPRSTSPSISLTLKPKSAPVSVVKPTFSTETAPELLSTLEESTNLTANEAIDVVIESEQISAARDDPLDISFSGWDDFIIDQILEAEEFLEIGRLAEQTTVTLHNHSAKQLNEVYAPESESRGVQEASLCQSEAVPQNLLEHKYDKEKMVASRTVEPKGMQPLVNSKLKEFISKKNSRKERKALEQEDPRLFRKGKQNPSIEDLVIIEIPASGELLRCLTILQTAGSPLLKELQQKKIKIPATFASIRPEHTRTLVRQIYQYRKSKVLSRTLTRDDDRLYGAVIALHGLVKTADVLLYCDIGVGISSLKTFQASYGKNFGFNQWVEFLINALSTSEDKKELSHPKMLQLCRIVEQYEVYRGRIVVVFPRFLPELQHILKEMLNVKKVSCSLWEDQRKADVYLLSTQNAQKSVPASRIALVIHYEDSPFRICGIKSLVLRATWSGNEVNALLEAQKRVIPQRFPERKAKPLTGIRNPVLEEQELLKTVLAYKAAPIKADNGHKRAEVPCRQKEAAFKENCAQFDLHWGCKDIGAQDSVPQHPNLPVIFDKLLVEQLEDAVVVLESELNCTVYDCDYSFMDNDPTVRLSQPDIICDAFTCIIVTGLEDDSLFDRVLKIQPKCGTLWVLLWSAKLTQHKFATFVSFAQFVNKTPGFLLKWHVANSQASLATAVEKTAAIAWQQNVEKGLEPWKEFNLDDDSHWRCLVQLPCFHAFSAWLLLHRTDFQTLSHVDLDYLISTYPEIPSTVLKMFYSLIRGGHSSRPVC